MQPKTNRSDRRQRQLQRALHALQTNPHRHVGPTPADEEDLAANFTPGDDIPHPFVWGRGNGYGRSVAVGGER